MSVGWVHNQMRRPGATLSALAGDAGTFDMQLEARKYLRDIRQAAHIGEAAHRRFP